MSVDGWRGLKVFSSRVRALKESLKKMSFRAFSREVALAGPLFALLGLFLNSPLASSSESIHVAVARGAAGGGEVALREWSWVLRGGGVQVEDWDPLSVAPLPQADLLIVDAVTLPAASVSRLKAWVRAGGLLLWACGPEFEISEDHGGSPPLDPELAGVSSKHKDPGLLGLYPRLVKSTPLLSPLLVGDGLRLGKAGLGHQMAFSAINPSEVLAESAGLHLSDVDLVIPETPPTLVLHRLGQGQVLFVGFSLAEVAACYPSLKSGAGALDCSGAGSAHALMRWLSANLLWEFRHQQIPLLFEAPGDQPHAVIITGDVHDPRSGGPDTVTWPLVQLTERLGVPFSLYIDGAVGRSSPELMAHLHQQAEGVEVSTHNLKGKVMLARKYWFKRFGMYFDLLKSESLLGIGFYPFQRQTLLSIRSHGWISDRAAWWAYRQAGIGLVFDQVGDSMNTETPWRVTPAWFDAPPETRLFVPIFEHNIKTAKDDFSLDSEAALDMTSLASAQPEPVRQIINYARYSRYVDRWHRVFGRLSSMGGLTEVWLWHPEGVAAHEALGEVQKTLEGFKEEAGVSFQRGDVLAGWRANRERMRIKASWGSKGLLAGMLLEPPLTPLWPLPEGSPKTAHTIGYWVLGEARIEGWSSRMIKDPYDRTVTILTHSLNDQEEAR